MATLFVGLERLVPTWLAAARHLQAVGGVGRNLVLEIDRPGIMRRSDINTLKVVDERIIAQGRGLSIETVASTIFPQGLFARLGRPAFYNEYFHRMDRAKKPGTWGQYFERMTRRLTPTGAVVNPLEDLISKLARVANGGNSVYQSTYELSPSDPSRDISLAIDDGGELATYDPGRDRNRPYGGPCLSHLSFKISDRQVLDLTAIYRSHHYCQRALGNLLGLARLQKYVADGAGLSQGMLTCISTHAELDLASWGGVAAGRQVLNGL